MEESTGENYQNTKCPSFQLIRFKVILEIRNITKQLYSNTLLTNDDDCPVTSLKSLPSGDCLLCPLNDGKVAFLSLDGSSMYSLLDDNPRIYFPDYQMEHKDMNTPQCESCVEEIAFSPFDEEIFILRWSNGLFGLFHRREAIASIYFETWNYLPKINQISIPDDRKKKKKKHCVDSAVSVQWSESRPCSFYVLTSEGYLITFNLLKSQSPVKYEKVRSSINSIEGCPSSSSFDVDQVVEFQTLISSHSKSLLPKIVTREKGKCHLFRIEQITDDFDSLSPDGIDTSLELKTLQSIVCKKLSQSMDIDMN